MEQVEAGVFRPEAVAPGPDNPGLWRFLSAMIRDPLSAIPKAAYSQPVTSMSIMGKRVGIITDPAIIEDMLVGRVDDFPKSGIDTQVFGPVLGNGLLTANGADWKWKRQLAAPYFAATKIERYVPDMTAPFERLAEGWCCRNSNEAVEVSGAMTDATIEVISGALFKDQHEIDSGALSKAIDDYLKPISWVVGLASLGVPSWIPHPGSRQLKRARLEMRALIGGLVDARRQSGRRHNDICGDLMIARDPASGRVLSDEDMVDMLLTLVAAGHETSANGLTWALYCLAQQPALQDELAEEANSASSGGGLAALNVAGLIKVEAFIKETMRLFPPAPLMVRQTRGREVLGGHVFAAGSKLFIPLYALHRHEKLWDKPTEFRMNRFLDGNDTGIGRTTYMPFGAGPRVCLGGAFAMTEMKVALASMLKSVRFGLSNETACNPVHRITLRPKDGLWLTVAPV